jgi:cytochrome c553
MRQRGPRDPRAAVAAVRIFLRVALTGPIAAGSAASDTGAPPQRAMACVACHGERGNSRDPTVPSLAGQQRAYIVLQLVQYREQRRKDPRMSPFAEDLSDADIEELADYYAQQKPSAPRRPADPATIAAGRKVAQANHCGSCHMADLTGQKHVPRLVGLPYEYLVKEMRAFKQQTRAELDGSMTMAAQPLSAREIEDVAGYIASLPADPRSGAGRAPPRR